MSSANNPHDRHGHATAIPDGAYMAAGGYAVLQKMRWRTPPNLVQAVARDLRLPGHRFDLDAAAEDGHAVADRWLTHEEDCLVCDWRTGYRYMDDHPWGESDLCPMEKVVWTASHPAERSPVRTAFINPPLGSAALTRAARDAFPDRSQQPFPGTAAFAEAAIRASRCGLLVAVLMPVSLDQWQKPLLQQADEVWFGPRVRFLDERGREATAPPGPTMVVVYSPRVPEGGWPGGPRVRWDWRP